MLMGGLGWIGGCNWVCTGDALLLCGGGMFVRVVGLIGDFVAEALDFGWRFDMRGLIIGGLSGVGLSIERGRNGFSRKSEGSRSCSSIISPCWLSS